MRDWIWWIALVFLVGTTIWFTLTPQNAFPLTLEGTLTLEEMWEYVQKLAEVSGLSPPDIEVGEIPPKIGKVEIPPEERQKLAGVFLPEYYKIIIHPQVIVVKKKGYLETVILHELVHAALYKKGMSLSRHHCWMAGNKTESKIARWVMDRMKINEAYGPDSLTYIAVWLEHRMLFSCKFEDFDH